MSILVGFVSGLYNIGGVLYTNETTFNVTTVDAVSHYYDQLDIILSNASGTNTPGFSGNYTTPVIYTGGATRADWADLNFTDSTGAAAIPFYIWNNTATSTTVNATVYLAGPITTTATQMNLYYGNSSMSGSLANGLNTFPILFDDFLGTSLNTTTWSNSSNIQVLLGGSGVAFLDPTSTSSGSFYSSSVVSTNSRTIKSRNNVSYVRYTGSGGAAVSYCPLDITPPWSGNWMCAGYVNNAASGTATPAYRNYNGNEATANLAGAVQTTMLTSSASRNNTGIYWTIGGGNAVYHTSNSITTSGKVAYNFYGNASAHMAIDWVFVENHTAEKAPVISAFDVSGSPVSDGTLAASFDHEPSPSAVGQMVNFTDTSTGTPTTWNWTIGGVATNTTQNASYLFASAGTYPVNLNVTNATGHFSDVTINQVVINQSGFTQQDIWMEGQYLQTFNIVDSNNLPIANVTIGSTSGNSYTTSNGTGYLTEPFGAATVTFVSNGYNSRAIAYVFDSDDTHSVTMYPTQVPPSQSRGTVWIPQQVRIRLVDETTKSIDSAYVIATPLNFTAPANWTNTLLGIDPDANIVNESVTGFTGSDGSWAAPMLASIEYSVHITKGSSVDYTVRFYPSQTEYVWMIPSTAFVAVPTAQNFVAYSIANATINNTAQYLNVTYADTSGDTSLLIFNVYNNTGSVVHSESCSLTGNTSTVRYSYEAVGGKGQTFTYGIFASQSQYGWINQTKTVTWNNQIALIGDAPSWVEYWLSVGLIIITAGVFGILAKRFMLLCVSIEAWFLQYYMGWFDIGLGGTAMFGLLFVVGALIYIRESENKLS